MNSLFEWLVKKSLALAMIVLLSSAPVHATGDAPPVEAFNNNPQSFGVITPNDARAAARKSAEVAQWLKLQEEYNAKTLTNNQYVAARNRLKAQQGGPLSRELHAQQTFTLILDIPAVVQVCKEYCGPASTYEMLKFSGNTSLSQRQIAALERTGACTPISTAPGTPTNNGTCAWPIRDTLNAQYYDLPYRNFFITHRLDHSSRTNAYNSYSAIVDYEIDIHVMPFMQLVHPKTCDGVAVVPGWENLPGCGSAYNHYLTTIGFDGLYNGSAGSRTVYFDDTVWWEARQKHLDVQKIAHLVYDNNGEGSCDNTNIIY